jgi:hypothetical protein
MSPKSPPKMIPLELKVDDALAEARQGFAPMLELTDADHEYILAHGNHDGASMESTRKRARARGWTEEQIQRHYPPCDCSGCSLQRIAQEMRP